MINPIYNYNKKSVDIVKINKKIFLNNIKKNILLNLFFNRFPKRVTVASNKTNLKKGKILKNINKNQKTFFDHEYIYFNKYTFNFFILDVDHKNYTINDFINILDENFIAPPNWIVETKSGYQIGFVLEKPFNLYSTNLSESDKKAIKYTKYLLKKMLTLFKGDLNTIRLQGFWKNPIGVNSKFKLYVNNKNFFNLSDFDIYSELDNIGTKENETKKGNAGGDFHSEKETIKYWVEKIVTGNIEILKDIKIGYRNSFIWYLGMYLIKSDKKNWEERLNVYNINLKKPLRESEMENIKKSIKRYTKKKKNFIGLGEYKNWTRELKNIYIKQYQKKKGIVKHHREELKEINKNKLLQAIYNIRKEKLILTNKNLVKYSGLGLTSVKKYKKILIQEEKFKILFEDKKYLEEEEDLTNRLIIR